MRQNNSIFPENLSNLVFSPHGFHRLSKKNAHKVTKFTKNISKEYEELF